jgi:sugar lactone lactonase YvrE
MRRIWGVGTLALLAALVPVQAVQAGADHLPDQIDLPNGWQPEGITTDGRSLYVGSLADGAIWRANPRTGNGEILAPGRSGRVAVGVDYDRRRDVLWVAGGATSQIRAHDADTGKVLRTYSFPLSTGRFLNDLVVTRRGVFATDSMNQELAVVPFKSHGDRHSLPPRSKATTLPLTGDLVYVEGFNLNGIVRSHGYLLAVQSNTGLLFRINQRTGVTHEVDLGGASLANGDGLEIDEETLYVVRNQDNLVAVVELDGDLEGGELVDEITSPGFDVPTTAALARDSLWVVNARFNTPPAPDTPYWITRVDEYDD